MFGRPSGIRTMTTDTPTPIIIPYWKNNIEKSFDYVEIVDQDGNVS